MRKRIGHTNKRQETSQNKNTKANASKNQQPQKLTALAIPLGDACLALL
jgi:hypothetical protein